MHCEDALKLIEKLADGESTAKEKARAEAHMETCNACREHFRFLNALPEAARRAPIPSPPELYWEVLPSKVMARIEERRARNVVAGGLSGLLPWSRLRWLGGLAAAVIAVVVGVEIVKLQRTDMPRQAATSSRPEAPKFETAQAPDQPVIEEGVTASGEKPERSLSETVRPQPTPRDIPPPTAARALPPRSEDKLTVAPPPPQPMDEAAEVEDVQELESRESLGIPMEAEPRIRPTKPVAAPEAPASSPAPPPNFPRTQEAPSSGQLGAPIPSGVEPSTWEYRLLDERYNLSAKRDDRTLSAKESLDPNIQARCRDLRRFVERYPDSKEAEEARYRLALCSIQFFDRRQTEESRRQAVEDAKAFLRIAQAGERLEEIQRELARIQP